MSIFDDLIERKLYTDSSIVTESVDDNADEFILEAVTVDKIPYLKMLNRQVILPQGEPKGKGNICYLYSNSFEESLAMINNTTNFLSKNYYRYYYYPIQYMGYLYNKRYKIRDIDQRKLNYKKLQESDSKVHGYPRVTLSDQDTRNTYYDLYKYINIFNGICSNITPSKYIKLYWDFFSKILTQTLPSGFTNKILLINMDNFEMTKELKKNMLNPLFTLYYTLLKDYTLLSNIDLDFYFYSGKRVLKVNPSKCDDKSYTILRTQMKILVQGNNKHKDIDYATDEKKIISDEIYTEPVDKINEIIGNNVDSDNKKVIEDKVNKIVDNVKSTIDNTTIKVGNDSVKLSKVVADTASKEDNSSTNNKEIKSAISSKVEEDIDNDKELLNKIYNEIEKDNPKMTASSMRDKLIKERQKELNVGNLTLRDIERIKTKDIKIEERDVSNVLTTPNENMKHIKFEYYNKTYNEKLMKKDIMNAFLAFNDKSLPMYILKIDIKDTSDELNYKDTYTVLFEDENRKRHTIKVDIPKFVEDKFLYVGGNKKVLKYQSIFYPVVKVSEDTVHITTNYNKIIMNRNEKKSFSAVERFKKLLNTNEELQKACESFYMNVFATNKGCITTLEYDDISKFLSNFKNDKIFLIFSQLKAEEYMVENKIPRKEGCLFIGVRNNKPIYINTTTQLEEDTNKSIVDIIYDSVSDETKQEILKTKPSKVLATVEGKVMAKFVKIGILIGLWEGFTSLIKRLNVKYHLENKLPELKTNEAFLKFKDCYFVYEDTPEVSLLLNGFNSMNIADYNLVDLDKRESYTPYLIKRYGHATIENALFNCYEFTIDPITKEVLHDMDMPTDIVGVLIYATKLLADSQYTSEINQGLSRIRGNEVVPAILYERLAKKYIEYRNSNGRRSFNIPQNCVIQELVGLKTVENYSTLNPMLEAQLIRSVSSKGFRGVELDQAYTVSKRSYDQSMIGVIAPTTSPDGNAGVNKELTLESNINNLRGYVDIKEDKLDELKDANIFSPTELTMPLCGYYDDPNRLGHAVKQSSHVLPVKKSSPVLISNGMEEAMRFHLSHDFVYNADESGEVIDYDEKSKIMVVKYKSGKTQAINLAPNIVKNSNGGFFLSNEIITDFKVGDKFKKNDVLAYHKDFFMNTKYNNCRMNMGTLAKVAIMSNYNTYEDGTMITKKLSDDASTEMCFLKSVTVKKNSNVEYIVKKGDKITVGEPLISFDTSFDDQSLNAMLANMSDSNKAELMENSRNTVFSKFSGVIEDIKIYATIDLDEMSPTLRKIVSDHYKEVNHKKQFLDKYDTSESTSSIVKCGMLVTDTTKKVVPNQYGVIKGEYVEDGVLFEFYVKHSEPLEIGSKIACFAGLKNTIDEIIEEGFEPWSEYRPDEEVSLVIAANSILNRMVPSIFLNVLGNKCIVELKRHLEDIYRSSSDIKIIRPKMENLITKFFNAMDTSKSNTKTYQEKFKAMSDAQFKSHFKGFFEDEDAYLTLSVVDYEHTLSIEEVEAAAKVLDVPLFEYVYDPHLTMDKSKVIACKEPVPVGYLNIKRPQQTVMKKNGMSIEASIRSAVTGQVTGADKNGRESDTENAMLISMGLTSVLKELNSARADDPVMKEQMLRDIQLNGYTRLADMEDDPFNKITLNTTNVYFLGMGINTDLVTKGLMLPKTIKMET